MNRSNDIRFWHFSKVVDEKKIKTTTMSYECKKKRKQKYSHSLPTMITFPKYSHRWSNSNAIQLIRRNISTFTYPQTITPSEFYRIIDYRAIDT